MQAAGEAFHRAGVAAIYLLHGTFAGDDAIGLFQLIGRLLPGTDDTLRRLSKQAFAAAAGEIGNYTQRFAHQMQESLGSDTAADIPVRLAQWSGENHHLGRANAAILLIDEMISRQFEPGCHILLWGHSHAGNVFALITNLLGADDRTRNRFFGAARSYYHPRRSKVVDVPAWQRVQRLLADGVQPLADVTLDIVTFGTPVRYGWDTSGYAKLLHFVNHRPDGNRPAYQACFPPRLEDVWRAAGGDYVQQMAIAGTNIQPPWFMWSSRLANRRLSRLVQGNVRKRDLLERLTAGVRVADEGTTLLVDYGLPEGRVGQHVAGHAVYTRPEWMLCHVEEVARRFYARKNS